VGFYWSRRERVGRVVTLTPAGEVDLRCAGALRAAIQDTLRTPHPVDVIVDLRQVTFLDCAGIGALVDGRNTAARRGRGYRVVNLQPLVHRVLDLTGVLTALTRNPGPASPTGQRARSPQPGTAGAIGGVLLDGGLRRSQISPRPGRARVCDGEVVPDSARR
jgi:anti-anti-sigma factor